MFSFRTTPIEDQMDKGLQDGKVAVFSTQNSWSIDRKRYLADVFRERGNLAAYFGPRETELTPGTNHIEFSREQLEGLNAVVVEIQDVGSRSYTFISSLGLMMRACAEQGIEVMVLDRPNPVNGLKVEGCLVEDGFHSFVSEFKIPYVYGLTVGELAVLINEEGLNCGEQGKEAPLKCKLSVIPMEGWTRDMTFVDTGLPWVLPSPNIPYPQSAIGYPSSGLVGEFNNYLNIGVGYTIPFGTFAAEWLDAEALKAKLDSYDIPGTSFRTIYHSHCVLIFCCFQSYLFFWINRN